jgi:hypothetical protein
MTPKYRCTVITPLLDSNPLILDTFEALEGQLNEQICWLVKNSAPDHAHALDRLRRHEHVVYVERADTSLYDAVNQALETVESEYYFVIGAGDRLAPDAVPLLTGCLDRFGAMDALFFAARRHPVDLTFLPRPEQLAGGMTTPHPGAVLKTECSRRIGGYDTRYRIAADYDHVSRYAQRYPNCGKNDHVLTHYLGGGVSEARLLESFIESCLVRLRVWSEPEASVAVSMFRALEPSCAPARPPAATARPDGSRAPRESAASPGKSC